MFTGIVEAVGRIDSLEIDGEGGRLRIAAPGIVPSLSPGASIAVNGCCLTVVECADGIFASDLSSETIHRTSFAEMKSGSAVNLERPLAAGAPLGGHFVQGHVDAVGQIARLLRQGENWWLSVRVPEGVGRYVATKGSIAIDGISLTVAGWGEGVLDCAIIPFTYARTNLCEKTAGDALNLEADILAKYVERLLEARREPAPARFTVARLVEEGF